MWGGEQMAAVLPMKSEDLFTGLRLCVNVCVCVCVCVCLCLCVYVRVSVRACVLGSGLCVYGHVGMRTRTQLPRARA